MSHQNAPPSYIDNQFAAPPQEKATDVKSQFATTSPGKGLAGPQTFAWVRNGMRGAKIYLVPPPVAGASDTNEKKKKDDLIPNDATPSYNLNMGCKALSLYSTNTADKPSLSADNEGFFNTRSTFYDDESYTRRSVQMYRATGEGGGEADSLMSRKRTFDDFDSYKYKWSTSCTGNQECVRISDGVVVASFKRFCFSFKHMGHFTLHTSVPDKTLQLLLITCGMCYQLQSRRHKNAILPGGGGGGGGGDGGD